MPRLKKRADGRYQKKVTLPDGTQKFVYATSEKELNKKAEDLKAANAAGVDLNDKTTVGAWAVEWFKVYKSGLADTTRSNYLNLYNKHILPYIGSQLLKDIKPIHAKMVMTNCNSMSESLQKKVRLIMKQLFEEARRNGMLARSPIEGIAITKQNKPQKIKYLSNPQYVELMREVDNPTARVFCALCLYAGLRRGEALALQWGDIENGYIKITRAVAYVDNFAEEGTPKTQAGYRSIPVTEILAKELAKAPRNGIYVVSTRGMLMSKSAFRRMWDKVEKAVSFNKITDVSGECQNIYNIHPHMLRHTYCTMLYNAGIDLRNAQYLMGHSSINVTAQIYTHIQKHNIDDSAAKINRYLSGKKKHKVVKRVVRPLKNTG